MDAIILNKQTKKTKKTVPYSSILRNCTSLKTRMFAAVSLMCHKLQMSVENNSDMQEQQLEKHDRRGSRCGLRGILSPTARVVDLA